MFLLFIHKLLPEQRENAVKNFAGSGSMGFRKIKRLDALDIL